MGGFATARGFVAVRVGFLVGFFVGVGVALRLGAAPIDSTALADGLGSSVTSSEGVSVGASVTATGAARSCGVSPLAAQPTSALANRNPASAAAPHRPVRRIMTMPPRVTVAAP